jgi:steroid 5-alpha reductase family enzyme
VSLLISALILVLMFAATWRFSVRSGNYSWVDVTWALSFTPAVLCHAWLADGWAPRRVAIALMMSAWSLRLGLHLWRRISRHHPHEDARYAVLRERWKANVPRAFLGFFLAQAFLVWLLVLPAHLIAQHADRVFSLTELIGLAVWCLALLGEAIADQQLSAFNREPGPANQVCRKGLWRWSRHPNYFFQSLLWWGLFLMALPAPWGWTSIAAPLAMLHFLLNVTGIPLTERLSVAKRGDAYRDYQRTTSAFVPWFPKS